MTIRQLKEPCWVLDPSPYPDDDCGEPHYPAEAEAAKGLRELREDRVDDYPERLAAAMAAAVKREESPCWVAECDADGCGERYEDPEDGGSHFPDAKTLGEWMAPDGWTYRGGDADEFWPAPGAWTRLHAGEVFCPGCSPEGAAPPPLSPADLEAAGQLRLPGVA
jgi:hypothetical protein